LANNILKNKSLIIFIVIIVIVVLFLISGYNTIVKKDEAVKEAWGNVETAYQRRFDLIPNLVNTVKAYAAHERETLEAVVNARSKVGSMQVSPEMIDDPEKFQAFQNAQNSMSSALSRLLVVVEKYPDLKANQNFLDLQHQLEGTENRINVARVRYNEAVKEFNQSIRFFPKSIINKMFFGYKLKESFKSQEGAENAPKVEF
jgi:LemA protein